MSVRRFDALYHSRCADCGEWISPGDRAGFIDDLDGARCEVCCDAEDDGEDKL